MGVTAVKHVENRSRYTVALFNIENPNTPGHGVSVAPRERLEVDMWIPWANASDFSQKHLRLNVGEQPRYWIWQSLNADGDHVRFSTDGAWHDRGEWVDGISAVDGDRTLVVMDNGFQVVSIPSEVVEGLRRWLDTNHYRLTGSTVRPVPSVPKSSAVAFSVAGPPSDARNCVYRDSGKRYEFAVENGVVVAIHPNGRRVALTEAISYDRKRTGERGPAPPVDLVAASGGRVFAKARGDDRFYFAVLDEMFMHETERGTIPIPSTYFKLDPEFNQPEARKLDLSAPVEGSFANHPAAERFPLFRTVLELGLVDLMVVRKERGLWHLIDARPPLSTVNLELAVLEFAIERLTGALAGGLSIMEPVVREAMKELERRRGLAREGDVAPPEPLPTYEHVTYRTDAGAEARLHSIAYRQVLDIGVGHVHWHEQYEGVTRGEMQPMLDVELWANLYRLVAGPIRDGDGYIDGTCNFYALVELEPNDRQKYALLFQDEQSYFTQRWRLAHPDDSRGLTFAISTDLDRAEYEFDRAKHWCPFRAGEVGSKSRMAVAAQVVLVTGDESRADTRSRIYSTNFSWASMDRTWRWRLLPGGAEVRYFDAGAVAAGSEPIGDSAGDSVYPQTIRLREDMTVHLKGTRERTGKQPEAGRWYQRYLTASNCTVPPRGELVPNARPPSGYVHHWKFLPEQIFQLADRFSHLGIYDSVDSRCQYYVVEPASGTDAQALAAVSGGPWVDTGYVLYRWAPKLSWSAPLHLLTPSNLVPGVLDRRPPSLFNRETRLRIVRRGGRWIATHWDKRDDDLIPFGGPFLNPYDFSPIQLELRSGGRRVSVTLRSHRWLQEPPAVRLAEFRWSAQPGEPASLLLFPPAERPAVDDLWRIRIAALVRNQPGHSVPLLNVETAGRLRSLADGSGFELRWTPTDAEAEALRQHCSQDGARDYGTSIWFEDIVGHVSVPEQVRWVRTPGMDLAVDKPIVVKEADSAVDTGIDLRPGDDFSFEAGGTIWAGVWLTGRNGPQGWNNVDHDPKFPLHEGPDAHPFSLIGRFGNRPYFFIGTGRERMAFVETAARRLWLRTNDDSPGNGNGEFTCRVRVWRPRPPAGAVTIAAVLANPAGDDVQPEAGEHVTLRNSADTTATVGGWYLTDAVGHRLSIPAGYEIPPGGELRVYTGLGTSTPARLYCRRRAAVLNNTGDTLVLHAPDGLAMSTYRY